MFHWVPYPFVRIVAAFSAGIITGIYFPESLPVNLAIGLLFLLAVFFGILFYFRKAVGHISEWTGVTGLTLIFLLGYVHLYHKTERNDVTHLLNRQDTTRYYTAMVMTQPQEKENTWKIEATMKKRLAKKWEQCHGKLILYLSKQDFKTPYQYGDVLLIKGHPDVVSSPNNPHAFNYQQFLSYQNIYHQQYLNRESVSLIKSEPPNSIMMRVFQVRSWATKTLRKYVDGEQEQAIVLGLVLGIKDGLDDELISAFAASGGMHVLAVSGLHVGIIYWLVLLVFRPVQQSRKGKVVIAIIAVIVLWGYALVTGMSPSVLRAVTMFTFVALAVPWKHRTNIYNTLAISACCLLLYNPYLLMAVGFQLSYAAVLGIVYLQPMLVRVFTSRYHLINKIWELTTVSIAAQLATSSIGLLYFHQFPVYFLFSNLIIIPCAFLILLGGLGVLIFSFINPVAGMLGYCLGWILRLLKGSVRFIEVLPFSLIDDVYLTSFQCGLILLIMLVVIALFEFKKFRYLLIALMLITIHTFLMGYQLVERNTEQRLVVYDIAGRSAFDIFEEGRAYTFMDSALMREPKKIQFNIHPNRLANYIDQTVSGEGLAFTRKGTGCMIIKRAALSILWITEKDHHVPLNADFNFLLISNNALDTLVMEGKKNTTIIIDGSNSSYLAKKLISQAKRSGYRVHCTRTDGAFVFEQNLQK